LNWKFAGTWISISIDGSPGAVAKGAKQAAAMTKMHNVAALGDLVKSAKTRESDQKTVWTMVGATVAMEAVEADCGAGGTYSLPSGL